MFRLISYTISSDLSTSQVLTQSLSVNANGTLTRLRAQKAEYVTAGNTSAVLSANI